MAADRDLLFGLLALQNGMVSRDQLVAAFGAWTAAPGRPLADLLAGQVKPFSVRARRWAQRNRTAAISAAVAGLVALTGTAVVLAVQTRANRDLRAANERTLRERDLARQKFDLARRALDDFRAPSPPSRGTAMRSTAWPWPCRRPAPPQHRPTATLPGPAMS